MRSDISFRGYDPFAWRLREAAIVYRNATREIVSPLQTDYWSMTPYKLGPDRAIKYAARPCEAGAAPAPAKGDPDYLRAALKGELEKAPGCMELFAQMRVGDMPLDDASVEWSQAALAIKAARPHRDALAGYRRRRARRGLRKLELQS